MKKTKVVEMTQLAILGAIIVVMGFTPIGYIRTAGIEITLITIPVTVGAIVMGPTYGAILGAIFGATSFAQCFGFSQFGTALVGINPFLGFIVCMVPRILMGLFTGYIFKGLKKIDKTKSKGISYSVTSLSGALLNTVFFMTTLILCFGKTEFIVDMMQKLGGGSLIKFILAFVGVNGLIEAAVCFVVATAISKSVDVAIKKRM